MIVAILESAVRSSLLMVLVWLLLYAARVRSPAVERTAWLAVLAASIAMPFVMNVDILPAAIAPSIGWLPGTQIGAMTIAEPASEWQHAILWTYLAVALVLTVRQLFGLARLWRLRAAATPLVQRAGDATDVRTSSAVSSPATVFSTILVPADFAAWGSTEREAALAHESAHVAHRDFYVQALACLHRHLFWFNPLAWWLPQRLSLLSEHMSDDAALAAMGERTAYAELLVSCARRTIDHEQAIAMARATTLATRIERILDASATPRRIARWKHAAVAALLAPVIAVSASLQASQQSPGTALATYLDPATERARSALPPAGRKVTLPKSNRARPLSQPVYPPVSRQLRETGTVVLKLHVLEDGSVGDAIIDKSSGYPSLDYAAMYESFRWQLDPGTVDGQPQRMWGQFAVTFKMKQ
jgi:TonB family protein